MPASIVVAWELGSGMGHIVPILPLVRQLRQAGHRVSLVLRDLSRASDLFSGLGVACFQAPLKNARPEQRIEPPRSFAHILHNCGYADLCELQGLVDGWRNLFDLLQPDLLLCDHSPTALLAARGRRMFVTTTGIGFCCPPYCDPFPDLRPWLGNAAEQLHREEQHVLEIVNQLLDRAHQPRLERLWHLFSDVDEFFLATFRELDPYPGRGLARYWGAWPTLGGESPQWPKSGQGQRVFAYLHQFPSLPHLFRMLRELRVPTLAYCDSMPPAMRESLTCETIHFADRRVDLVEVGKQCDVAILNGGHGTTASMLLSGRPLLQIPLHLEQTHNGLITKKMGVAETADAGRPAEIANALSALLNSQTAKEAAQAFARRYIDFDPKRQLDGFVARIQELLDKGPNAAASIRPDLAINREIASDGANAGRQERQLVIGLGTGRCGTKSLAALLSCQPSTVVMHETQQHLPWHLTDQSCESLHRNLNRLFDRYPQVAIVGDVAHYYLPYVPEILSAYPKARFVCLQRDRTETIESFLIWIARTRKGSAVNHWSADRQGFDADEWDDCFPKYETRDMPQAIGRYWDEYNARVREMEKRFPENFRLFPMDRTLNEPEGVRELLDWVGIPGSRQRLRTIHLNGLRAMQRLV